MSHSSPQPFVVHDMDTLWQAENGLVWNQLIHGAPPTKEIGVHVFYRCQCTTVETVRELTEFAKSIPGFVGLYLNDQVTAADTPTLYCLNALTKQGTTFSKEHV